jgi:two-component system NtrC family sensor kinase
MGKRKTRQPGNLDGSAVSLPELAESEQRFRKLVEALPDAILVHCDDRIVFVNPFCVQLLAAQNAEELLGKNIAQIISPEWLPVVKQRIADCYASGKATSPSKTILIACDGSPVEIESVAIPTTWNRANAIQVVIRDVRGRKQAEREITAWRKRLELAQQAGLGIGFWDWDINGDTIEWSDEVCKQFGYAPEKLSSRVEEFIKRIHPDDQSRVWESMRKVLWGFPQYAEQFRILWPDGTTRWIDAHGIVLSDGPTHMLGITVDITHIKQTEKSLRESEERYLLLLNSTAEAIYGVDLQGNCTFSNPACLGLLGYRSTEDLLGKCMHELTHYRRSDGTPYPVEECQIYRAIWDGKPSHASGEVFWRADGTSFPAEYWSYPMRKDGDLVGSVVTFIDVTERQRAEAALRKSEEKYRILFENATYGIYRSSLDGSLLDVNPALIAMLGYSSKEELMTKNLGSDIYLEPAQRQAAVEKCRLTGRADGVEVNWKRRDGKVIDVRLSARMISDGGRQTGDLEVIVEDITARRALEDQLRQSQKMEALGLLAGGISHDFNNHLNVILGNSELLLDKVKTGQLRHYGEEIKKATTRAAQLTRQILAYTRRQVLYPTVLDLNEVISDVCKILPRLIGEDIEILIEPQKYLASTRADRGQMEQILMNLATNARDAMPNGGRLTIRTENADLGVNAVESHPYIIPGRFVRLSVSDCGLGMSEEVSSRVFEPFFTTKIQGQGTGLGLSMVYGIVKQSSGYIWVSSAPGVGTTFDIYLPRVDEKAPPTPPDPAERDDCPGGIETILVLEDEEALREVICEFLKSSGYNVLQAGRADIAFDLAEQFKGSIPLMISDVVLPDRTGSSATAKVQALHPETKVLYVSGYAEAPVVQELIAEGATLLQKPVSRKELLREVDAILHAGRARPFKTN